MLRSPENLTMTREGDRAQQVSLSVLMVRSLVPSWLKLNDSLQAAVDSPIRSLCEALLVLQQYMDRCLGWSVISSSVSAWPNLICCPVSLTTMMLVRGMSKSSGVSKMG